MKMDLIEGSETSAIINQTPGNYPKENLLYSEHGESLKSRIPPIIMTFGTTRVADRQLYAPAAFTPWYSFSGAELTPGHTVLSGGTTEKILQ